MSELKVVKKRPSRAKPKLVEVREPLPLDPHETDLCFTAVGLVRRPDNLYAAIVVRIEHGHVVEWDIEPDNMKQIAVDSVKIAVMKRVIDAVTL